MKLETRLFPFALTLGALLATACGGDSSASAGPATAGGAPQITAAVRAEAETVFQNVCVTCHGDSGHGDGPGAAGMQPQPRSFADPAWQESVTDEHIVKTITLGGAAVGKSPMMPAQPQLKGDKAVLAALVQKIRSFEGK